MTPQTTLRRALNDPRLLGDVLAGDSWRTWRTLLIASQGEPLDDDELAIYRRFTGRDTAPTARCSEAALVVGRRGGKDRATSVLATYLSGLCDYSDVIAPGEVPVVLCLGADQRQAQIQLSYIRGTFEQSPLLGPMVTGTTVDTITLSNGVSVESRAASFRRLRGVTAVAVIASELAYWMDSDQSANPDAEILGAVRPALLTTGGPLILISSPYRRSGELFRMWRENFGPDGDPGILVAQGTSRDFNPTLSQAVIDAALARDPAKASAEYLAQWRSDIESYISREAIEACIGEAGVIELPPRKQQTYFAHCDPSGGSGTDSMTLAIAHRDGDAVVIDAVREVRPPFSPDQCVHDFAALLSSYGVTTVQADRYAAEWPVEAFRKRGIRVKHCEITTSDTYRELLPLINTGMVTLPDNDRLIGQLAGLERRHRTGKDLIGHARGAHDDLACATAGVCYITTADGRRGKTRVGYAYEGGQVTWLDDRESQRAVAVSTPGGGVSLRFPPGSHDCLPGSSRKQTTRGLY